MSTDKSYKAYAELFNFNKFDGPLRERKGSQKDVGDLKKALSKFCSSITKHPDLYYKEFIRKLQNIAKGDHSQTKYIFIYLSSHGIAGDQIFTRDVSVPIHEIVDIFKDVKCPKIFMIQACRGETYDDGASPEAVSDLSEGVDKVKLEENKDNIRQIDDVIFKNFRVIPRDWNNNIISMCSRIPQNSIIAYSTPPNRYSWRNRENGGYYVQTFIHELNFLFGEKTNEPIVEIQKVIQMTHDTLSTTFTSSGSNSGKKQVGQFISTLDDRLFLDM